MWEIGLENLQAAYEKAHIAQVHWRLWELGGPIDPDPEPNLELAVAHIEAMTIEFECDL